MFQNETKRKMKRGIKSHRGITLNDRRVIVVMHRISSPPRDKLPRYSNVCERMKRAPCKMYPVITFLKM